MRQLTTALLAAASIAAAAQTTVEWSAEGWRDGQYLHSMAITGDKNFSRLAFNALNHFGQPLDPADTLGVITPGYYYIASPRIHDGADTVVVTFASKRPLTASRIPDGLHRILPDGTVEPVAITARPFDRPAHWTDAKGRMLMPAAEDLYALNERLSAGRLPGPYDAVPSYKSVTLTGGSSPAPLRAEAKALSDTALLAGRPEYYRITIADGRAVCEAATEQAARNALAAFLQNISASGATELPNAVIEDWPSHVYRGLMVDIARNFLPATQIAKLMHQMRDLRLNVLHFHFADDEGWRLELPSLPELTEVGSRRGYTPGAADPDFGPQYYRGDGNPDSPTTSNGYITRAEFVDLLRLAQSLGITVIPEIESPGHARAAVEAMERRHRHPRPGLPDMHLRHDGDTSRYTSAQGYHDCVMNPALETTYQFMATVFDDLAALYAEAGVPLEAIHIGGDEVAKGAWSGSARAHEMMDSLGMTSQAELHAHFVQRMARMLAQRGIKMSGWEDIAFAQERQQDIAPALRSVNFWTNATPRNIERARRSAQAGIPVVMTNVDYLYFDQCFSPHPAELGLAWGGYVDDLRTLDAYPSRIYPGIPVSGVEATLFGETIDGPERQEAYIFPKLHGAAERAWNADSTYTHADFTTLLSTRALPALARQRVNFHVRQPGIRVIGDSIHLNSPYAAPSGAQIRYTTDGTEPTATSPLYTPPLPAQGIKEIRARLWLCGRPSPTTYLLR